MLAPEDKERAEYQRNRAASEARQAELAAMIEQRKQERSQPVEQPTVTRTRPALKPAPKLTDEARQLLEIEAQIAVFETKLDRKKKPLGWARRQAMKQQVAELK